MKSSWRARRRRATCASVGRCSPAQSRTRFSFTCNINRREVLRASVSPLGQYARNEAKRSSECDGFTDLVGGEHESEIFRRRQNERTVIEHLLWPLELRLDDGFEHEERAAQAQRFPPL